MALEFDFECDFLVVVDSDAEWVWLVGVGVGVGEGVGEGLVERMSDLSQSIILLFS